MQVELIDVSVVIIANDVNLSIFKPAWLAKMKIFREDELSGNIVIAPVSVQIPTNFYVFTVLPNRLQMSFQPKQIKSEDIEDHLNRILGGIVETLPHTPYTAVGLNFHHLAGMQDETEYVAWEKKHLCSSLTKKLIRENQGGERFGSYVSFDIFGARLKIDIKPTIANEQTVELNKNWLPNKALLRIDLNFHYDVTKDKDASAGVLRAISNWRVARKYCDKIAEEALKG